MAKVELDKNKFGGGIREHFGVSFENGVFTFRSEFSPVVHAVGLSKEEAAAVADFIAEQSK